MVMALVKSDIPYWLQPPQRERGPVYSDHIIETALEMVAAGRTLLDIGEDPNMPSSEELRVFIMKDPKLRERYEEARAHQTDWMVDRLEREAAGGDGDIPDEVQRSSLKVKTLMWKIEKLNPKRFGPRTQVDVTHTYDISAAMQRAQERLDNARRPEPKLIEGESWQE